MTADQMLGVLNDHRPSQTKRFMPWMTADQMLQSLNDHSPDVIGLTEPQTKCYWPQMTAD